MRLVKTKVGNMKTGANFEGSRWEFYSLGTVEVVNIHNAGPAYCVGYCGNAGSVTRTANMNLAKKA